MKLQIKIDGTSIKIGINIRPYALTFLKKMTPKFEIVIFTASHHSYADAILD
jgi:TFIIF-interacting CTD phosphatase-like protein